MKQQKIQLPNLNDWERLPTDIQLYITAQIILANEPPRLRNRLLKILYRVDIWLFPPCAFLSSYLTAYQNIPTHPIKLYAVLSIAFMSATLTLFLIRPRKWKKTAHWIKPQYL